MYIDLRNYNSKMKKIQLARFYSPARSSGNFFSLNAGVESLFSAYNDVMVMITTEDYRLMCYFDDVLVMFCDVIEEFLPHGNIKVHYQMIYFGYTSSQYDNMMSDVFCDKLE